MCRWASAINPYGLQDWLGKHMSRTVEAWMTVDNLKNKGAILPFKSGGG